MTLVEHRHRPHRRLSCMQKNTKISPTRPRDGPRSTRYPISSYTRTRWLSPSVVSYTLLHGTGAFPAERGGRPYRTSTMPDAEWEVPRSWKRRGRGRHESREYDRKANIPFVPANVILPRVILCCRRRGRANGGGRTQCPG